jgi:hypothetical protein
MSVMEWSQRTGGKLSDHKFLSTYSIHRSNGYTVPNGYTSLPWIYWSWQQNHFLAQGQTQGSMLQQHTNKTLTTRPFRQHLQRR